MKEILKRHPRYHLARARFEALPDNLWVRCPRCEDMVYAKELESALDVCPKCKYHFAVTARQRIAMTLDEDTFAEYDGQMRSSDPLNFEANGEAYRDKLGGYAEKAGEPEAFLYGTGQIEGLDVVLGVTEFKFSGGSMGAVFGEKLVRAVELARRLGLPLVIVSSGGGARMQEGAVSLLQMSKTVAALERLKAEPLPFISVMADPCLGGMTASYAMLGDVNVAEPGAYIGFAGRRVIEQTMRQKLPADAATAEFLQAHGMVDAVVPRTELRPMLARLLRLYATANRGAVERGL